MRNMSFMLTTEQIRNRTKTVTRRVGWTFLKPGDLVRAVERCQGLKKGEKMRPLAVLRVENVRREVLAQMTDGLSPSYGVDEVRAEGFQEMTPAQFVEMFCATHKVPDNRAWGLPKRKRQAFPMLPCDEVTRIEFSYVDHDHGCERELTSHGYTPCRCEERMIGYHGNSSVSEASGSAQSEAQKDL
jgi:hypothetical protein